ncbi:pre-mRNA cleavage complex 2 protein Pcf11 isoform X2 [Denticeps clupeoides]|uniref:pre-mRNA cleavage complex 2 protein Pcf11 isoform X2 n=1 Tax=Denticeps clupeoides TaxID=299321 RepID=UPI0010A4BFDE|nr:pre-mRNA cleavage complex 2 protein Pcf11 isoform X2 [Denticeps clupeoides]
MSDEAAREDARREYQSSLEDLTFNSKPHINMLTILAEENLHFAKDIVAIIEAQIDKAPPAEKLPVLYLVDSIVKNVGGEYLAVFAKNLVSSFICVFEKVDENTRKSLFKLRSTWDEIFPLKKLYALDVGVNAVDPAWPIKPLPNTEDVATQRTSTPQLQHPVVSEKSLTQEQVIRQQLLAKQKQLLELQQKKIELELEQTKAQLVANQMNQSGAPINTPQQPVIPKITQQVPHSKTWPTTQIDKFSTRDPRLNRTASAALTVKEQVTYKKEPGSAGNLLNAQEKRGHQSLEKQSRVEKTKLAKKDVTGDDKPKSKSASPLSRGAQGRCKNSEPEHFKVTDPRLQKYISEKAETKEDDRKRSMEKKDKDEQVKSSDQKRLTNSRGKLANGTLSKQERNETSDKQDAKVKKAIRKRSRSRSRSPSAHHSPIRKERRRRHLHAELPPAHTRQDRTTPKKSISETRRPKRSMDDRSAESRMLPESKENVKRWKSGWEGNKPLKQPDDKSVPQRHKSWTSSPRPAMPRIPRHRLSVDVNLQIPDVLNSASKRDLLKKASKRHADGEISQEDFIRVAYQINRLFQYQEEKQRSDSWEGSSDDGKLPKNKTLLSSPQSQQGNLSDAEKSYFEHKSKLRRTQVQHPAVRDPHSPVRERASHPRPVPEEKDQKRYTGTMEGTEDFVREPFNRHHDPRKCDRLPPNSGLVLRRSPSPSCLDGASGKSPLAVFDQLSSDMETQQLHVGEMSPRFESPNSVHSDTGPDVPLPLELPSRHEILSAPSRNMSGGIPCESPGHTPPHSSEGSITQASVTRHDGPKGSVDGRPNHVGQSRSDVQARTHLHSRYEGNPGSVRYDGAGGPHGSSRFDGHGRYENTYQSRFEGPALHKATERFDSSNRFDGPMRSMEPHSIGVFDASHPQQSFGRFDGPVGPQSHGRFDGPGPMGFDNPVRPGRFDGPMRFDCPMQQGPGRFEGPIRFQHRQAAYDGTHGPPGRMRFDGPGNQSTGMCFENPSGPMIFEGQAQGIPRYDCTPQQVGPRYCGPPNLPNQLRPQGQVSVTNSGGQPTSNFNMTNRFSEPFGGAPQQFQQNVSQGQSFSVPVATLSGFSDSFRSLTPFTGAPVQQTILPSLGQPFIQQTPVPFSQAGSQIPQPESHLGQMDVNDLLSKLISTGIIKPTSTDPAQNELSQNSQSQTTVEEEDDEEQVDDESLPDLTSFVLEDMKQRFDSVITKLYTGIQCYSCGMRFTASQTDVYADHLDWHYRQNRSEKDISKKVTHRRWYYSLTDWIEFEEIADLEERAKSNFFEKVHEEVVQKTQEAAKEKEFQSVKATPDAVFESCEICQEQFEMYWEEEEEEWHLKNAIRVDEKTYHPSCYEDYKNTSSFVDCTPSPNKVLTDPLNAFLTQGQDEMALGTSIKEIKEEPEMADVDVVVDKTECQVKLEGDTQTSAIIY